MEVNVCDARLDDFVQDLVGLLVVRDSHSDVAAARTQAGPHTSGQMPVQLCRQLVEAINLASVLVYDLNSLGGSAVGVSGVGL